jgi:hypothetical protein
LSWTSGFLASKKTELVRVVAVVSKPASRKNRDCFGNSVFITN